MHNVCFKIIIPSGYAREHVPLCCSVTPNLQLRAFPHHGCSKGLGEMLYRECLQPHTKQHFVVKRRVNFKVLQRF